MQIDHISILEDRGGIGVVVKELHWTDGNTIFDFKMIAKARRIALQLQKISNGLGIEAKVAIMHTVDLGG